jgi:membrane protein YqaA with SNARE-associated domain
MRKKRVIEIISILIIGVIFLLSYLFKDQLAYWIGKEVEIYGLVIIFFLAFMLEIIPQYLGPHVLIVEARILEIPLTEIYITIIIGSLLGSILAFEIGKKFGKRIIKKYSSKEFYKKLKEKTKQYGKWVMVIAGISPIPYLPIVFGSLEIKRKDFFLYGIIPRMIGYLLFSALMYFV